MNPPISQLINLFGKTAIVTGGAMGIGLGIAKRLAEAGASVVIADMNETVGTASIQEITDMGFKAAFVKTDVSNEKDVSQAVAFAITTFGGTDILVNNAGIYPNIPLTQMEVSKFDQVVGVNLRSVFLFTKAVTEVMIKQGRGGKIINITSVDALHPSMVGLAAYDSTKHAVWGFTKNAALEFAPHNIWINAIAPGGVSTPGTGANVQTPEMEKVIQKFSEKIPMKRMGESDEIGRVALFLASDLSSYMTGSQIVVDGGVLLA
jgi:2-deoxy-D-gluconate 3-dehydrogenase